MTTQTVELDPSTGLPKIDEGMLWRVVKDGSGYLRVELINTYTRTKKVRAGWFRTEEREYTEETVIGDDWFSVGSFGTPTPTKEQLETGILRTATLVYRNWRERVESGKAIREVVGDYPPKNLNSL